MHTRNDVLPPDSADAVRAKASVGHLGAPLLLAESAQDSPVHASGDSVHPIRPARSTVHLMSCYASLAMPSMFLPVSGSLRRSMHK
jgi:hypothetical protein